MRLPKQGNKTLGDLKSVATEDKNKTDADLPAVDVALLKLTRDTLRLARSTRARSGNHFLTKSDIDAQIVRNLRKIREIDEQRYQALALHIFGFFEKSELQKDIDKEIDQSETAISSAYAIVNRGRRLRGEDGND